MLKAGFMRNPEARVWIPAYAGMTTFKPQNSADKKPEI